MLGLQVTVPIACFRKGMAREYLETEMVPPPATCYGFLLSLVGETRRTRHVGIRVTPVLVNRTNTSVVLRTVWRVKKIPLGSPGNTRPDYQQLLTGSSADDPFIHLLVWLDSTEETTTDLKLEERVRAALTNPGSVSRFGGLSLGESTHLVDQVQLLEKYVQTQAWKEPQPQPQGRAFLLADKGRLTLPVWVDHVGSAGTRYVTGDLAEQPLLEEPPLTRMPRIEPPERG
jgi:CRISPR-associated protein Cas5t